jgi:hypothetical protein
MTTSRTRRRCALAILALPILAVSCKSKEQPAPPAGTPQPPVTTAPVTTLPPPTTVATPPTVWRTARWGMTKAEVLAAFPAEAQRLPKPVEFVQPQPGSSVPAGSGDLTISAYEADGTTFRVLFGFEADALNRVHLSALKPGEATCGDVEKRLTEQHSAPPQRSRTGTSLRGDEMTWKRPDQTIILTCAGVPNLGFQSVSLDHIAPGRDAR